MKLRLLTDGEAKALDRLAFSTTGAAERVERIEQAVMISQFGGVEDRMLEALLHLAATRQMTPTTVRHLREVGIDPSPWRAP